MRIGYLLGTLGVVSIGAFLLGGCGSLAMTSQGLSSTVETVTNGTETITDGTQSTTDLFKSDADKTAFVAQRYAVLRAEAARGGGENLAALAWMLNKPDRAEFARAMRRHYAELYADAPSPTELLARIERLRAG